jgi:hypothetical protein
MFTPRGSLLLTVVTLVVFCDASSLVAGVTTTNDNITTTSNAFYPYDPQNAAYGVTTFNMTGANSAPVIQIVPDNDSPNGLGLQDSDRNTTVSEGVGGTSFVVDTQTFTPTSTFTLGAIAVLASGRGTTVSPTSYPMTIHLYDLVTGYASSGTGTGGNPAWPGYIPNTSGPGGTPAPDLFGGGNGLQVTYTGESANAFYDLNFNNTGTTDNVTLQAGHHYAIEFAPGYNNGDTGVPIYLQRMSGSDTYFGGNPYGPGDGYKFTETQNNDLTTVRGNLSGADRDFYMAIYAAPAPTILAGDMNFDGHVDAKDIAAMQLALTNMTSYLSTYGTANGVTAANIGNYADVTGGGKFNNSDLQALLNYLKAGDGSASAVPEPASVMLLGMSYPALFWIARRRAVRHG